MAQDWRIWIETAQHELREARGSLGAGSYQSTAFFSQQIAELSLSAVLLHSTPDLSLRTHDLVEMAAQVEAPEAVVHLARVLNPQYRGSRYPHLANGNPVKNYDKANAGRLLKAAEDMHRWCAARLPARTPRSTGLNAP